MPTLEPFPTAKTRPKRTIFSDGYTPQAARRFGQTAFLEAFRDPSVSDWLTFGSPGDIRCQASFAWARFPVEREAGRAAQISTIKQRSRAVVRFGPGRR